MVACDRAREERMVERYFPMEEYEARQRRVMQELKRRGHRLAVIWGRGGACHERGQDVLYLANYYSSASGQEPDNRLLNGRAFNALILEEGEEPELLMDLPGPRRELLAVERVSSHFDIVLAVADALGRRGAEGKVALVGSDFLPARYMRQLEEATPRIAWQAEDDLVAVVRRAKSPRELACYREGAAIVNRASARLMEGLVAGRSEAEAASAAAEEIVRAGGNYLMIACSHGDTIEAWCREPLTGYSTDPVAAGDMVRGWILGPIWQGYYLDPGRTAVAGGRPSPEQRALIEACGAIVERLIAAIRPGVRVMEVAQLGERLTREAGGGQDQAAEQWPLYGHNIGLFWEDPYISTKMCSDNDVFEETNVLGIETFLAKPGVGAAGFEQNLIVTKDGTEILTTNPMYLW